MASQLNVAVIGVGYLGFFHSQKYHSMDSVNLVAVCDTDPIRCQNVADEMGCLAVTDYTLLARQVDAVSIVTPTSYHFEVASYFISRGIHVLIEKPMSGHLDHAKELVRLADRHNVILQVGFIERFNPAFVFAKQFINQPLFIEVTRISPFSTRSQDIDVVFDLMIHDIDLIQYIVGSELTAVNACSAPVISNSMDIASVRLEFASGCTVNITSSRASVKSERRMRVFQRQQYINLNLKEKQCSVATIKPQVNFTSAELSDAIEVTEFVASEEQRDQLAAELFAFINAAMGRCPPVVPGIDGLKALQTAVKIEKSIHSHYQRYGLDSLLGHSVSTTSV